MFRYVVFNEDGRITQSHKVYDPTGYPNVLLDNNIKYVHIDGPGNIVASEASYVKNGRLRNRPLIVASISKVAIKADGNDAAVIKNLPKKVYMTVDRNGIIMPQYDQELIEGGEIDFGVTSPGTYGIKIESWPYQNWTTSIFAGE